MGLKRGDIVTVSEAIDGSLRLATDSMAPVQPLSCLINIGNFKDKELVGRLIVGTYLLGFESIKIVGPEGIPEDYQSAVASTVDLLPGMEVVEQTYRRVIIQSFVDPRRFPVETLLKRIQVMVTTMINYLGEAFGKQRYELLSEILRTERKIDELYFLSLRQIFVSVRSGSKADTTADTYIHSIGDRLVVRSLEDIADSVCACALEALPLKQLRQAPEVGDDLAKLIETVQVVFGKTMKAFFSLEVSLANEVINTVLRALTERLSLAEDAFSKANDPHLAVIVRSIVSNVMSVLRNCKTIAEVTLNRFVRTPSRMITIEAS